MRRLIIFLITHGVALGVGFGLGVYLLPILTAPDSPDSAALEASAQDAMFWQFIKRAQDHRAETRQFRIFVISLKMPNGDEHIKQHNR